jgi:hypothetical protein
MTCASTARSWSAVTPFTAPRLPTGMNAGVSKPPWGVSTRPTRAPVAFDSWTMVKRSG